MGCDLIKKLSNRWGPTFFAMGMIFVFSSIPMKFSPPLMGPLKLTPELLLKKGAHLLGYALLALALQRRLRLRSWKGVAAIMCCVLLYSISDEFHQSFVPRRSASYSDCRCAYDNKLCRYYSVDVFASGNNNRGCPPDRVKKTPSESPNHWSGV